MINNDSICIACKTKNEKHAAILAAGATIISIVHSWYTMRESPIVKLLMQTAVLPENLHRAALEYDKALNMPMSHLRCTCVARDGVRGK